MQLSRYHQNRREILGPSGIMNLIWSEKYIFFSPYQIFIETSIAPLMWRYLLVRAMGIFWYQRSNCARASGHLSHNLPLLFGSQLSLCSLLKIFLSTRKLGLFQLKFQEVINEISWIDFVTIEGTTFCWYLNFAEFESFAMTWIELMGRLLKTTAPKILPGFKITMHLCTERILWRFLPRLVW